MMNNANRKQLVQMYKNVLYLTAKLTALVAVVLYTIPMDMLDGGHAAGILAFCCLFLVDFLLDKIHVKSVFGFSCLAAETACCFLFDAGICFPVLLVLIFQLAGRFCPGGYFYAHGRQSGFCSDEEMKQMRCGRVRRDGQRAINLPCSILVSAVSVLLLGMITKPPYCTVAAALVITALFIFGKAVTEKLEYCKEVNYALRGELSAQQEKIARLVNYSKTLRETTVLEERSRFSTRIHDRLGHGISGSIILLEGVKLNLKTNPEQAEKSLGIAIENLRGSVDSIREALREERPAKNMAGIAQLREMLERFCVAYGIKTDFSVEGDTEKILPQIWNCLKENLTEALTNTVKHSNADRFMFRIYIYNKIIRVEFSDNGTANGAFSKGMGLDAMEERTAVCGGSCSFSKELTGFKIVNVFKL